MDGTNSLAFARDLRKAGLLTAVIALGIVLTNYFVAWLPDFLNAEGRPMTSPHTTLAVILALMATFRQRPLKMADRGERALWALVVAVALSYPTSAEVSDYLSPNRPLGQMGWNTALSLIAMAMGQILRSAHKGVGLAFAALSLFLPVVALNGYIQGVEVFFGQMSLLTAVMLFAIGGANLVRFARHPWIAAIIRKNLPGRLIRTQLMLWFAINLIISLGIRIEHSSNDRIGPFLHTMQMIAFLGIILYFSLRFARLLQLSHSSERRVRATLGVDPLTGAATRKGAQDHFDAINGDMPVGVILFDIDRFKDINDDFGHDVGDQVLVNVAEKAQAVLGPESLLSRWGGEEFLVILRAPDLDAVHAQSALLQRAVASVRIPGQSRPVTASFGATLAFPSRLPEMRDCVAKADRALYTAKKAGRDCVRLAFGRTIWDPQHILERDENVMIA